MEEGLKGEHFVLNVYRNGELDDVIEGAAAIKKFIKGKKDSKSNTDDNMMMYKRILKNNREDDRWGA